MKRKLLSLCLVAVLSQGATMAQQPGKDVLPYQNTELSPEQRAEDLLKRLTLEEKARLMVNGSKGVPRLGIKPYEWWNEALHGVARAGLATVFPQTIGMAASFDDDLLLKVFTAVSDEARVKQRAFSEQGDYGRYKCLTMWTPNVNIFRDPRWGRGQETYGEDPYLTSRMGMAVVRGLQGPQESKYNKLHACAKHFAVHSGPEWNRHSFDAKDISLRDLWETYLPAFKALVQKAGVKEVMCAYNRYEGDPCCGSNRLLTQILRNEWGFNGIVVSDCGAITDFWAPKKHLTHADATHASAGAVLSGTDVECGSNYANIPEAVRKGLISEERVDISVRRLLKARFELGEMDSVPAWQEIPASVLASEEHNQLALQMAREGLVLLQNNRKTLPLNDRMTVAVVGPNANDSVMMWGNYNGTPSHTVTLLQGLKRLLPEGKVIYQPVCGVTEGFVRRSLFDQCRSSKGNGFEATYWNNSKQEGTAATSVQQATAFTFQAAGGTAFASGVKTEGFSARYVTQLVPNHTGKASFRLSTNGRLNMTVNGVALKEANNVKQPTSVYTFDFKEGETFDIVLNFEQVKGNAYLNFDIVEEQPTEEAALLKALKKADVVVFAGGISPQFEGEEMSVSAEGFRGGDRTSIELPEVQRRWMQTLKKAGKKVVLVNFSGSAMGLLPESECCDAILQAWYPGQEGGTAVAEALLGKYNPAGRLPITFYRSVDQLPDFEDYAMKGRTYRYFQGTPLFAFGYGLSYTQFAYQSAQLDKDTISYGEQVVLTIPVQNVGKRAGEEVVQVYLRRPGDADGPIKSLRGFQRIALQPGETKACTITLPYENFEWFDEQTGTMHPMEGTYELLYGSSSREQDLKKISVQVTSASR
jgi:beta-glucosidase